jgi:hypothetical protein
MKDLELAASLLECYIVSNNKGLYALFCNDTGRQCSYFYTLAQWAELNEAEEVLNYTGH